MNSRKRWAIPEGLLVSVARVDDALRQWQPHTMQRTLQLVEHRGQGVYGSGGAIVFRHKGWWILTRRERLGSPDSRLLF